MNDIDIENMELRSEKVRNIVGAIPSLLLRCGIIVILAILLLICLLLYSIQYSQKQTFPIRFKCDSLGTYYAIVSASMSETNSILNNMEVDVYVECIDGNYNFAGYVDNILEENGIAIINIMLESQQLCKMHVDTTSIGMATIVISRYSILQKYKNIKSQ